MISGFISNKCIAQEKLDHAQKQFDTMSSKIKTLDDPINYVNVKIQTPNFPLLEIDRTIFCDNYSQVLREIPTFRQIPELSFEGNKRIQDLLNNYKESIGLTKYFEQTTNFDDLISDENNDKKPIQQTTLFNTAHKGQGNSSPIPTNPYANLNLGKGPGLLVNSYVAGEVFKNTSNYEESNKNNLIRSFKQKTGLDDQNAIFYLESAGYDLQKALEIFNNN